MAVSPDATPSRRQARPRMDPGCGFVWHPHPADSVLRRFTDGLYLRAFGHTQAGTGLVLAAGSPPDPLVIHRQAVFVIFAQLGASFSTSRQALLLLTTLRESGLPDEVLAEAAEHYRVNRVANPFIHSMMGD